MFLPLARGLVAGGKLSVLDGPATTCSLAAPLLLALAALAECAQHTPSFATLAAELLGCAWPLRGHPEAAMRRAVLVALSVALSPRDMDLSHAGAVAVLQDMGRYLTEARARDPDGECRAAASRLLHVFPALAALTGC
jgi:hypothetical protein